MTEERRVRAITQGSVVEHIATGRIGVVVEVTWEPAHERPFSDVCYGVRFAGRDERAWADDIRPFLDPLA